MPVYARLKFDGSFDGEVSFATEPEPETIRHHLPTGVPYIVPLVDHPAAEYDKKLQRLDGPFYRLQGGKMHREWRLVDLTPEERTAALVSRASLRDTEHAVLHHLTNRIRALEGKAPLTTAQFDAMVVDLCMKDPRR